MSLLLRDWIGIEGRGRNESILFFDHDLRRANRAFNRARMERLEEKEDKGWTGWDDPQEIPSLELRQRIKKNVRQLHWVDVANLAMMLWAREKNPMTPHHERER